MAFFPVAGCKFSIGTALDEKIADFVVGDFTSITWTEVGKWLTMGNYGDSAAEIPIQIIGEGRDKSQKGTRNAGMMENVFAALPGDPGQAALLAALDSYNNFAFKIELNDKPPTGASPKNGLRYFVGLVMTAPEANGQANSVRSLNVNIKINSNIVRVAPSAT